MFSQRVPGGILVPVLAGDADPALTGCIEQRREIAGMYVDHQRDPIPLAPFCPHQGERKPPGRRGRSRYSLSIDMASSPCVCDGHAKASAVRIRAIARAVIGTFTSPWCWWQVPARGYRRGSGRLAGCALRRLRSIAPGENMRIHSYIIALLLFLAVVAIVSYVLLPS